MTRPAIRTVSSASIPGSRHLRLGAHRGDLVPVGKPLGQRHGARV